MLHSDDCDYCCYRARSVRSIYLKSLLNKRSVGKKERESITWVISQLLFNNITSCAHESSYIESNSLQHRISSSVLPIITCKVVSTWYQIESTIRSGKWVDSAFGMTNRWPQWQEYSSYTVPECDKDTNQEEWTIHIEYNWLVISKAYSYWDRTHIYCLEKR